MSSSGLPAALAVLAAANLLNNRIAPRAYIPTSLAASAALLAIARRAGCTWRELGIDPAALRRGPGRVAAFAVIVGAGYAALAAVPPARPLLEDARVAGLRLPEVLYRAAVRVPLGTVALEEIGFRGVLYALLRRRYGPVRATAISAGLFGLWHLLPAQELPAARRHGEPRARVRIGAVAGAMAGTAAGGVVFCELRRRDDSLVTPMAFHAALNAWGYLAAWAVTRRAAASVDRPGSENEYD